MINDANSALGGTVKEIKSITFSRNGTCKNAMSPLVFSAPHGGGYGARPVRRGRHRKSQLLNELRSEHGKRLLSFSLIGFGVFAAGLGMQAALVQVADLPKVPVYVVLLILSVQVNFLANYHWTWGDRGSPFWRSCWRYNIKRAAGTLVNAGLYPILIHCGMNYLVANTLLVVTLTPVNYLLGHFWTFATDNDRAREHKPPDANDAPCGFRDGHAEPMGSAHSAVPNRMLRDNNEIGKVGGVQAQDDSSRAVALGSGHSCTTYLQ